RLRGGHARVFAGWRFAGSWAYCCSSTIFVSSVDVEARINSLRASPMTSAYRSTRVPVWSITTAVFVSELGIKSLPFMPPSAQNNSKGAVSVVPLQVAFQPIHPADTPGLGNHVKTHS